MKEIAFIQITSDVDGIYGLTADGSVFSYRASNNNKEHGWIPFKMIAVTGMAELNKLAHKSSMEG